MTEGKLEGVQGCTAPPFFEMDCNAPPNFENFINNVPQMGVQNQIPNKAMHPCFEIPNARPVFNSQTQSTVPINILEYNLVRPETEIL